MNRLEEEIARILLSQKQTIAIAESCTGGLIAFRLTNIPGSSAFFERGAVTYSNRSKIEMLGVPKEVIENYGAVSEQTAKVMAEGVRKQSGREGRAARPAPVVVACRRRRMSERAGPDVDARRARCGSRRRRMSERAGPDVDAGGDRCRYRPQTAERAAASHCGEQARHVWTSTRVLVAATGYHLGRRRGCSLTDPLGIPEARSCRHGTRTPPVALLGRPG